jgi:hypothetical protein
MFGRAACSQADAGAKDENLSRRCLQERTAVTEATSIQFVPPGPRSEAEIFRPREPNVAIEPPSKRAKAACDGRSRMAC